MFVIPETQEVAIGGSGFKASPSQSSRLSLENKLKAKGWGLAHVVEHLPSEGIGMGFLLSGKALS
jgi:hypothetical protein